MEKDIELLIKEKSKFIIDYINNEMKKDDNSDVDLLLDYSKIGDDLMCTLSISGKDSSLYNLDIQSDYSSIFYKKFFEDLLIFLNNRNIKISRYNMNPDIYKSPNVTISNANKRVNIRVHRFSPEFLAVVANYNKNIDMFNEEKIDSMQLR